MISKKEQFTKPHKSRLPHLAGIIALLATCGILIYLGLSLYHTVAASTIEKPVVSPRSYVGRVAQSQAIQPFVENGQVRIKLADVEQLDIVDFELENSQNIRVHVMAYITSSGRLFVGQNTCACGSQGFFLAGEALACRSCRTTFTIEEQKFISGSVTAGNNPPARIKAVIENGMIVIDQADF